MEDLTGKRLGPYQIVAPLGEGGMAAVYKAYQPGVDRHVAAKILPRHLADTPQFVRRFEQEARLLANLQHPHILPVFDFGQADGYTYIVMPFVNTGTLADMLKGTPLPLPDIQRMIQQTASALDYAHGRGLIHRDIKPSNILLDEQGNCLLTDFGIAKLYEGTANLTRTGHILGTPAYMSPEQGEGSRVDYRSDIYSLGVMLYEMATGRVPFQAETPLAVVFKHINDPLPPPRTLNPHLPEAVERVILKALAKQPEDRFLAAGEMAQVLKSAISEVESGDTLVEESLSLKPAHPPTPTSLTLSSRRLLAIGAGGALLLLLLVGTWWGFFGRSDESPATGTSEQPPGIGIGPSGTPDLEPLATKPLPLEAPPAAQPIPSTAPIASPSMLATASPTALATATALPTATAQPGEVRLNPIDNAPIVFIPAGQFVMGMTDAQADYLVEICYECESSHFASSKPARTVEVSSFWIYQYEVTNEMYAACVRSSNCSPPARSDSNLHDFYWGNPEFDAYPVINVDWFAATRYCRWAGGRLPTEAEWEKAARGTDGRLFPWGNEPSTLQLANVSQRDGGTRPVGSYAQGASPYGVHDMAGNVWEWVADWYDPDYFHYSPLEDPLGPESSPDGTRVGKGGNWFWDGVFASPAYHDWWEPDKFGSETGFRCVIDSDGIGDDRK